MDIVGFVDIKRDATTCKGAETPDEFIGKTCPVMEFDTEGGALVLNPKGTALAMFDKQDIYRRFKCGYTNGVVTPPNLDMMEQMMYVAKAQSRKGGYNNLLSNMVIQASLMKGEFHDSMLWAKQ
jgi:hypothetical protein